MSSNTPTIAVEALYKAYDLYQSPAHRFLGLLRGSRNTVKECFTAISDVSFTVNKGEVVGIVGRNGCGKSTLLQLITGILKPTNGLVTLHGRVSAILELGAGFNPDATGRENIFINGAILGLSADAIEDRIASIIDFADIGAFLDRPVKLYSSGMYVRLAFAIAISIEPDILIIDEALSVGDAAFQRKCFTRIENLKKSGTTILFVSHSETTVVELCDRAILLNEGEKICEGKPKFVMGLYNRILNANEASLPETLLAIRAEAASIHDQRHDHDSDAVNTSQDSNTDFHDPNLVSQSNITYESHGATIGSARLHNANGSEVNILQRGESYIFSYDVRFDRPLHDVRFSFLIKTIRGVEVGGIASNAETLMPSDFAAGTVVTVSFPFKCLLTSDQYFLNAGVLATVNGEEIFAHRILDLYTFNVQPVERDTITGVVDFGVQEAVSINYHEQTHSK
ncbi:MAG: ABC transporter ATP-binding protein [Halieaceae bacterium]|nr:ABC transporter ATP-binding protein [Halieaceae bacterium]